MFHVKHILTDVCACALCALRVARCAFQPFFLSTIQLQPLYPLFLFLKTSSILSFTVHLILFGYYDGPFDYLNKHYVFENI